MKNNCSIDKVVISVANHAVLTFLIKLFLGSCSSGHKLREFYGKWIEALYSYDIGTWENHQRALHENGTSTVKVLTCAMQYAICTSLSKYLYHKIESVSVCLFVFLSMSVSPSILPVFDWYCIDILLVNLGWFVDLEFLNFNHARFGSWRVQNSKIFADVIVKIIPRSTNIVANIVFIIFIQLQPVFEYRMEANLDTAMTVCFIYLDTACFGHQKYLPK